MINPFLVEFWKTLLHDEAPVPFLFGKWGACGVWDMALRNGSWHFCSTCPSALGQNKTEATPGEGRSPWGRGRRHSCQGHWLEPPFRKHTVLTATPGTWVPASPTGVLLPLHGRARGSGGHRCEDQPLRLPPKVKSTCSATFRWHQRRRSIHLCHFFHIFIDNSLKSPLDEKTARKKCPWVAQDRK